MDDDKNPWVGALERALDDPEASTDASHAEWLAAAYPTKPKPAPIPPPVQLEMFPDEESETFGKALEELLKELSR